LDPSFSVSFKQLSHSHRTAQSNPLSEEALEAPAEPSPSAETEPEQTIVEEEIKEEPIESQPSESSDSNVEHPSAEVVELASEETQPNEDAVVDPRGLCLGIVCL
jgi:hypothetical protein